MGVPGREMMGKGEGGYTQGMAGRKLDGDGFVLWVVVWL